MKDDEKEIIMSSHSFQKAVSTRILKQGRRFLMLSCQATLLLLLGIGAAQTAQASTLNSTVTTALALPPNCPGNGTTGPGCGPNQPAILPSITGNGSTFTGLWPSYAGAQYQGSFSGSGPYPGYVGLNSFNFTGLTNGFLPAGSIVILGDLDAGSGPNESFSFTAKDSFGNPITSAWLESAFYMYSLNASDLVAGSMPEYTWTSPTYLFDGANVAGNPGVGVYLTTNQDIYGLDVFGTSSFAGFGIGAPTPEPGSLLLMGSGLAGLAGLVRRRFIG
jgi:hypothetical protein